MDMVRMNRPEKAEQSSRPMPPKTMSPTSKELVGPPPNRPRTVTQGPMAPRMSATAPMVIAVGAVELVEHGVSFRTWLNTVSVAWSLARRYQLRGWIFVAIIEVDVVVLLDRAFHLGEGPSIGRDHRDEGDLLVVREMHLHELEEALFAVLLHLGLNYEPEALEDVEGDHAEGENRPIRKHHLVLPEDLADHALRNAEHLGDLRVGVVVGFQR
jgi:hypothetical protein